MKTAKEKWEYFGENDPYFAVVTLDKFKAGNLTDAAREDFFQSGEDQIQNVWREITTHLDKDFSPRNVLDYGCGVGRLVVPLAGRSRLVYGVDISRPMLEETQRNCDAREIDNVRLLLADEFIKAEGLEFDLFHSSIVFQHIEPRIGMQILKKLLDGLTDKGIGVLHFTYANPSPALSRVRFRLYRDVPLVYSLRNLLRGAKNEPLMPMYVYDMNEVARVLQDSGCSGGMMRFSDHGFYGVTIFFQKNP